MAQKIEYIVEVSRTGQGSAQAVADLNAVDAAARRVNSNGLVQLQSGTKAATSSLKAMQNTAILLGGSTFPQVTMGALVLKEAFSGIKAAAAATGASIAAVSAQLGILALGSYKIFQAVKEFRAMLKAEGIDTASQGRMAENMQAAADAMSANIQKQLASGRLTLSQEEITRISELLSAPTNDRLRIAREIVQSHMNILDLMSAEDRLSFEAHTAAIAQLNLELSGTLTKEERLRLVNQQYERQVTLLRHLREDGKITEREETEGQFVATEKKLTTLIAIKNEVTQIQQLERAAAEATVSSLSAMILNFKNAQQAAAQLASTLANMIIQALLMRALFGATGLSSGTGGLIGGLINPAAAGGQFSPGGARRMAVGGVAELTQPTYFPRFNVLAGEAGREVMTVMARPRLMNVGGIAAQIGDVGTNRLALTNANDLQSLGKGGGQRVHVELAVRFDPGMEADIIGKSSNASLHLVTKKMGERGPLSEKTRRLMNS